MSQAGLERLVYTNKYKNFLSGLVTGKASVHKQIQELSQWLSDRKS